MPRKTNHPAASKSTKAKSQEQRAERKRKLAFEPLEERILLAADDITTAEAAAIDAGLTQLTTVANLLDQHGLLDQQVQGLATGTTLGGLFDFGGIIQNRLEGPVATYFTGDTTDSVTELAAAIGATTQSAGGLTYTVTGVTQNATATEFSISFNVTATRTTATELEMGSSAAALEVESDQTQTVDAEVSSTYAVTINVTNRDTIPAFPSKSRVWTLPSR
jgi:hypothetical protein